MLAVSLALVFLLAAGVLVTVGIELPWATPVAIALVPCALVLSGVAVVTGRSRTAPAPEPAREADALTMLWTRLSEIEARLAEIERHGGPNVRAGMTELTAEIGLLGGLMKDIAETVAGHDEHLTLLSAAEGSGELLHAANRKPDLAFRAPPEPQPLRAVPSVDVALAEPLLHEAPVLEVHAPLPEERVSAALDADLARAEAIAGAIEDHRVEIHLQPIVALPQRKVRLYEALTRLRLTQDELLVPFEFLPLAERRGLAAAYDERVVGRVLHVARHLARHGDAAVMCNLSPVALAEPGFLRRLARLLETETDAVGRIVLELPQRAFRGLDAEGFGALAALVERGVALSIDRVQDLRIDPLMLAERGVRFIKIPARMLIGAGGATGAEIHPADMPAMLARAGLALIAERVESETTVPDLLDIDVPLAQGFLFGLPRPVRADVYAPGMTMAAPASARDILLSEQEGEAERKPYRAFLRRASA